MLLKKVIPFFLMLSDAAIVAGSPYLAYFIRFEGKSAGLCFHILLPNLLLLLIVSWGVFFSFGLYHRLWRYASINELLAVVVAVTVNAAGTICLMAFEPCALPRSVYVIMWFLDLIGIGVSRLSLRILANLRQGFGSGRSRVLIVGAGDAGALIARELRHHYYREKKLVGFIDDDRSKIKNRLAGTKVMGGGEALGKVVSNYRINEIIIAVPAADRNQLRSVIADCRHTGCQVKLAPDLDKLVTGQPALEQLRSVNLEDLLRRDPVRLDPGGAAAYLQGKRVMVTGAGGSIGSELCRQIAKFSPATLYLLGKGENSIYEIDQELRRSFPQSAIIPVIADIRDRERIDDLFAACRPEVIFHAAAHKHVPLMEQYPIEAVKNNIFGTRNVAEAARRCGAAVMVMISTDKVVNPTSVMGATKRVAEQVIRSMSKQGATKFAVVRFGNVLGSRGSVVPLFKRQIAAGGPVTVTDPEMRRYFMTIPEAAQLVLQAGAQACGGEVFVLDMGEPVKIYDLACALIESAGLRPNQDIQIKYTGLRPGEKLFEELLTAEEDVTATVHEKIFHANLQDVDDRRLQYGLLRLEQACAGEEIVACLSRLVPGFQSDRWLPGSAAAEIRERTLMKLAASGAATKV